MQFRFDYVLVFSGAIVLILCFILIGDMLFASYNSDRDHAYDGQFSEIEYQFDRKNYHNVIERCGQVIESCGNGINDIKARTYIGLSNLKLGNAYDAASIYNYLVNKYPGIKIVYGEVDYHRAEGDLPGIYSSILTSYIPTMLQSRQSMSIGDMLELMKLKHWVRIIFLSLAIVAVYARLTRQRTTS